MPRPPEQYAAMRAGSRDRIRSAAVALFARHGPAATGMRDVARAAGISTGLAYRHFPSKDALFDDLVAQAADGLHDTARRLRADGPPAAALRRFTHDAVTAIGGDDGFAELVALMNHAFAAPQPTARTDAARAGHVALRDALAELVAAGQATGECRGGEPRELAVALLAAFSGLAALRMALGGDAVVPAPAVVAALVVTTASGPP